MWCCVCRLYCIPSLPYGSVFQHNGFFEWVWDLLRSARTFCTATTACVSKTACLMHTHAFWLTVTVTAVSRLPAGSLILHYARVRLRFRLVWFVCAFTERTSLWNAWKSVLSSELGLIVCLFVGHRGTSQDLFFRQRWRFRWRQGPAADEGQETGQWWGEHFRPNRQFKK